MISEPPRARVELADGGAKIIALVIKKSAFPSSDSESDVRAEAEDLPEEHDDDDLDDLLGDESDVGFRTKLMQGLRRELQYTA